MTASDLSKELPLLEEWLDDEILYTLDALTDFFDGKEWGKTALSESLFPWQVAIDPYTKEFLLQYLGVLREMKSDPFGPPKSGAHQLILFSECVPARDDRYPDAMWDILGPEVCDQIIQLSSLNRESLSVLPEGFFQKQLYPSEWFKPLTSEEH